ncbi:MAG: transcriptional repressor [Oscillospiraceae bacterium]
MQRRNTAQKIAVKKAMGTLMHATADEVYGFVRNENPNISRATVYRNLNLLAEQGEIMKIRMPDGADVFDITSAKHFHIRCRKCGKVIDADLKISIDSILNMSKCNGFKIESCELLFTGLCPECK